MKIRTTELLLDAIDEDLAWRKKELAAIKFVVNRFALKPRILNTALRAGVALLYAHWEGFLKTSAELYFEFIARQGLANNQLSDNFLAISARKAIHEMSESAKVAHGLATVDFFRRKLQEPANVPFKDAVRTESNLSSKVLRNMSVSVGVDYSIFETKAAIIDEKLLEKRNTIAHGQALDIDTEDFDEVFNEVTSMMETWRNEIENACVTKRYLNPNP